MDNLSYAKILELNNKFKMESNLAEYKVVILSNIIVHQIKEIFEYTFISEGINVKIIFGDYDNLVQDSLKYKDANAVIIFLELCNVIDNFYYQIDLIDKNREEKILKKTKSEIDFVLKNLEETSIVIMNRFTSLPFSNSKINQNRFDLFSKKLNLFLSDKENENLILVDIEKIIAMTGINSSFDLRYYNSSKALYTINFFKNYSVSIKPLIISACGKAKKALIFDCDNTLWKGVLGEDGFENIEMSNKTNDGSIFEEVQSIALSLAKKGVLIGICSKNNFNDVDKVIRSHKDMKLKDSHIVINKSNWSDKVTNLKEISKELNIGLDSLVFIDDSLFEVELVKSKLPEVTVLQVPEKLYEYPIMIRDNLNLFYNLSVTKEDKEKISMYKSQAVRIAEKDNFTDIEDYLASLDIKIIITKNDNSNIHRFSQMTQKTNQFNLTTKRYTESDINKFIKDPNCYLYSLSVSDKYGDSGITGLSIIKLNTNSQNAKIDSFMMSCRIIGRNIEFSFIDFIVQDLMEEKITKIDSLYIQTNKNEQVKGFYDNCLFSKVKSINGAKEYSLIVANYISKTKDYIKIINE